ncbi:MAG: DUF3795 domain-containing protein [Candidatus Thorarchaeota archaeon SMTZ1-45]|nr:MAG: hypothetical protein AM325_10980 [Candidatus Thorarchaeota archaeon SMTZ1-45]
MKQVISKCGNICSSCPWGVWIRKNQSPDEWESFVRDVKKYLGYTPTKNPCHGCQTPTENLAKDVGVHNFLRGCSARKCAFHNNFKNCAYCSIYPCDKIKVMNLNNSRKDVEQRIGEPLPDDKYLAYVHIFEGKKTLDKIRSGLQPDQIHAVKKIDLKPPSIVPFPEVKMTTKTSSYKSLHDILSRIITSDLGLINTDTLAVQDLLTSRRRVLLKLLWIVAKHGIVEGSRLSTDSITINKQKKGTSGFPTTESGWRRWVEILEQVGIKGDMELAPLDKDELISPIGWLRDRISGSNNPAWYLKIALDEAYGGSNVLKDLVSYVELLDGEFSTRAFTKFSRADMSFLKAK